MASLVSEGNEESKTTQLDRASRTELAAWRFLQVSTNDDSEMPPASLFLSKEQEQEIKKDHEKTVAADVERTNLRTNSSKEGEAKATSDSSSGGGGGGAGGGGQEYDCVICYESFVYTDDSGIWQNGILCHGTSAGAPHFICTDCFRNHVEYTACSHDGRFEREVPVQGGVSQSGEFPCPAANPSGCTCGELNIMNIYRALGDHQASFDVFNA